MGVRGSVQWVVGSLCDLVHWWLGLGGVFWFICDVSGAGGIGAVGFVLGMLIGLGDDLDSATHGSVLMMGTYAAFAGGRVGVPRG